LRRAIEAAAQGDVLLPAEVARKVLEHFDRQSAVSQPGIPSGELSQRELQVLQLAATGLTNKEIAGKLVISEKTVKNHVANIFSKLQVNDRTQAILSAIRRGLISINREGPG
jgi:two-component system NarL family response regulator